MPVFTSDILLVRLHIFTQTRCWSCFLAAPLGQRVKYGQVVAGATFTTPSPPHLLSCLCGCGRPTSKGRSRPDGRAWRMPLWISTRMVISSSEGTGHAGAGWCSIGFPRAGRALLAKEAESWGDPVAARQRPDPLQSSPRRLESQLCVVKLHHLCQTPLSRPITTVNG